MRRQLSHVCAVLAVAIAVRVLLFKIAGIWGDFGFYAYNVELVLDGQIPFVDFLGRSPLFIYSYAAIVSITGETIITLRAFILTLWLLTSIPVYLIGRHIKDHRTGLAAMALLLLTPFGVTYSFWENTQALAALLSTTAVYALLRDESVIGYAVFGSLVGLAFLSRRSVIVFLPAIALYAAYRAHQHGTTRPTGLRVILSRVSGATFGFFTPVVAGYYILMGGNLGMTVELFHTHFTTLFLSFGRGGWPMLGVTVPDTSPTVTAQIPIIHDVCQKCGTWTARTFAKTLVLTVPVAGLWIGYFRDVTARYFSKDHAEYLGAIILALSLYAIGMALWAGFYLRVGVVVGLALFTVAWYRTAPLDKKTLYSRGMVLVLLCLGLMAAGYLYRDRYLHAYYFMDFYPLVSVVAGVLLVSLYRQSSTRVRQTLAVALVIGLVVSAGASYPITNIVIDDNQAGWFTIDSMQEIGDDLDERTAPGDAVFAANPSYVVGSHATMVDDNARLHYVGATFSEQSWGPHIPMYANLTEGFTSGSIDYAIIDTSAVNMLRWNDTAAKAFAENYCQVDIGQPYNETNAMLFKHGNATTCSDNRQLTVNRTTMLTLRNGTHPGL